MNVRYYDASGNKMNEKEFRAIYGAFRKEIAGSEPDDFENLTDFQLSSMRDDTSGNMAVRFRVLVDGQPADPNAFEVVVFWPVGKSKPDGQIRLPLNPYGECEFILGDRKAAYDPSNSIGPYGVYISARHGKHVLSERLEGFSWIMGTNHRHPDDITFEAFLRDVPVVPPPEPPPTNVKDKILSEVNAAREKIEAIEVSLDNIEWALS
jgi:hypothetical protein